MTSGLAVEGWKDEGRVGFIELTGHGVAVPTGLTAGKEGNPFRSGNLRFGSELILDDNGRNGTSSFQGWKVQVGLGTAPPGGPSSRPGYSGLGRLWAVGLPTPQPLCPSLGLPLSGIAAVISVPRVLSRRQAHDLAGQMRHVTPEGCGGRRDGRRAHDAAPTPHRQPRRRATRLHVSDEH